MPSTLADPLYERLLDAFPARRAYTRADWPEDGMPGPVRHFLEQLLQHHSRREARRLRRARTEWVDYDHPEVEEAVRAFFDAVEAHTQIPADAWPDALQQATRHTTAYLVRPVPTLTRFVYGEQAEPLALDAVDRRMRFFGPYAYLRKAVQAYARERNLDAFGPDRFETFLYQFDERMTGDFEAARWVSLLEPLFETARWATDAREVPVRLLRTFFSEKKASTIEQALARAAREGHDALGPTALRRLITSTTTDAEASAPDGPPTGDAPPLPDDVTPDRDEGPADDDMWGVQGAARPAGQGDEAAASTDGADGEGATPLWQQFQQGRTRSASAPSESAGDGGGSGDDDAPLWSQFRQGGGRAASAAEGADGASGTSGGAAGSGGGNGTPERGPDLQALEQEIMGTSHPPHRSVYIRQLFDGDEDAYRAVLQRLRTADSWSEASDIIASDVFRQHKVNIYSDAAVHFTNAIEERFRSASS